MTETKSLPEGPATAAFIARVLDEKKASDIQILDVRGLCGFTDFFVIVTAETVVQLRALSRTLRDALSQIGAHARVDDIVATTSWVIVDADDVIVHLFLPEARQYYNLERLWGDAGELDWTTMEGSDEADRLRGGVKLRETAPAGSGLTEGGA